MNSPLSTLGVIALLSCFIVPRQALPVELLSQAATGEISGTVSDPQGAVVPRTRVTAINDATRQLYSVTTDYSGVFSIRSLPVGTYTVTVDAAGFQTLQLPGVVVSVGKASPLNIELFVGSASRLGAIKVTVRDSRGYIAGVAITVVATVKAGATTTGMSDSNGEYLYSNAFPGAYLIKAAGKDGTHAEQRIQLKSGQKKQIQLRLR